MNAYDVIRMLSREGRPTPLGDAIAHYGRIAKTLHILRLADEPGYRRQIKSQANLQEGRYAWPGRSSTAGPDISTRTITTARRTRSARSAWSSTPWLRKADVARLSPFVRHHVNMPGRYSFQLPDLPGVCARCASLGRTSFGSRAGPRSPD